MEVNKLSKLTAKNNKIMEKIGSISVLLMLKAQSGIMYTNIISD